MKAPAHGRVYTMFGCGSYQCPNCQSELFNVAQVHEHELRDCTPMPEVRFRSHCGERSLSICRRCHALGIPISCMDATEGLCAKCIGDDLATLDDHDRDADERESAQFSREESGR